MLNVHNFALGTVSTGYDAAAISIVLTTGHGARFPAGPFRATWWNQTDFPNPADDANREIVEVTTRSTDTLTIVRGLETGFGGLAASTKNTAGKVYGFALVMTAESRPSRIANPKHEVFFFDDFLYHSAAGAGTLLGFYGMIDNNRWNVSHNAGESVPAGLAARHSGFLRTSSNAASQRVGFFQTSTSFGDQGPFYTGGVMDFETLLWLPNEAVSDATNNYTVRIGLGMTNETFNNIANGMWFEYNHSINAGNWRFVTRQAAVVTNLDSSVAGTAGGEYRLKFVRNAAGNSVSVFINDALVGTVTTNVLADALTMGLFFHTDRAAGTAVRVGWCDYIRFSQTFDAR